MSESYGTDSRQRRRAFVSDLDAVCVVAAFVVGTWRWTEPWAAMIAVVGILVAVRRRAPLIMFCVGALVVGAAQGAHAWGEVRQFSDKPFRGVAELKSDALPVGRGVKVVFEIEGRRYDTWAFGSPRRRLAEAAVGDRFYVEGQRGPLGRFAERSRARHVVGRFHVDVVGDRLPSAAWSVASSRVRSALRACAERVMPTSDAALFTGLVIGDDARQPRIMVEQFRVAGLSHLTAVSGQNVAYVLLAAAPLLRRLRRWTRLACTVGLVMWFMALTRFEPSVLRAGLMASLSAVAFATGRDAGALRLLTLAVGMAVVLDPLLVWSVSFWLSVGATAGTVQLGAPAAAAIRGPRWLVVPFCSSFAAQVGVALPSLIVFGRLPVVSLAANLLAIPVAGVVMLYGLPAGLVAYAAPALAPLVLLPAELGVRWVSVVAALGARAQFGGLFDALGWLLVSVSVLVAVARHRGASVVAWSSIVAVDSR